MKVLLIVVAFLFPATLFAQQNPQYTQYIFNGMIINPAYTGSKGVINVNALHRTQWSGFGKDAPSTQTFSVDGSTRNNRIGLGMFMVHDRISYTGKYSVSANASVKLQVGANSMLNFGAALGAYRHYIHGSEVLSGDPNDPNTVVDPSVPQNEEFVIRPDLRAGLYFHTERYYAGLSVTDILYHRDSGLIEPQRHYYLTSGYVFDLNERVKLKPSFLLKEDFNGPTNIDLNLFLLFNDMIWLGGSYRTSANIFEKPTLESAENLNLRSAFATILELYPTPRFRIGYSYDFMLNELKNQSTHEISLGYMFFKKRESKMLTPQYF